MRLWINGQIIPSPCTTNRPTLFNMKRLLWERWRRQNRVGEDKSSKREIEGCATVRHEWLHEEMRTLCVLSLSQSELKGALRRQGSSCTVWSGVDQLRLAAA